MSAPKERAGGSLHGCFTGDCSHEYERECHEAISSYCAELEADVCELTARVESQPDLYAALEKWERLYRVHFPSRCPGNPLYESTVAALARTRGEEKADAE